VQLSARVGLPTEEGIFGFKPFAEVWVGRLAMGGFISSVVVGTHYQADLQNSTPAVALWYCKLGLNNCVPPTMLNCKETDSVCFRAVCWLVLFAITFLARLADGVCHQSSVHVPERQTLPDRIAMYVILFAACRSSLSPEEALCSRWAWSPPPCRCSPPSLPWREAPPPLPAAGRS